MSSITADPSILSSKRAIYVGGLAEGVNSQILRAAMIPFGNIKSLDIPMNYSEGKHRGFGFVEFEDAEDATEAIFNMDGADLMGRTISVDMAQANQLSKLSNTRTQAIWSSDEWFQQHASGEMTAEEKEKRNQQQKDQVELRN
mmetsp:Transcript_37681/g.91519  ORF Transcript_37681/g.91519 Transcript_37681/m.91519 type:complete len:143 (+) Transcript_37681:51-479(+)